MCTSSKNTTWWRKRLGRRSGSYSCCIPSEDSVCSSSFVFFYITNSSFVCFRRASAQVSEAPPCTYFITRSVFGFFLSKQFMTTLLPAGCLPSSIRCWLRKMVVWQKPWLSYIQSANRHLPTLPGRITAGLPRFCRLLSLLSYGGL